MINFIMGYFSISIALLVLDFIWLLLGLAISFIINLYMLIVYSDNDPQIYDITYCLSFHSYCTGISLSG
jgi:uncharacterized membrane protein YgaE (UPF0421/DUF939 family)